MQGGAVGSKSYLTLVEIHDAATIRTLTSPVAANQLAAGAFFSVKMSAQDLTSHVAVNQLAAGVFFFSVKMTTQDLTSPVAAIQLAAGAFFPNHNAV